MVRMLIAGFALCVAAPAAAQTDTLPLWLVGNWCLERPDVKLCVRYDPPQDGAIRGGNILYRDGQERRGTPSVTRVEDGVLVKRTLEGRLLSRAVGGGPNEVEFETVNPEPGVARRIRHTRSGNVLKVLFTLEKGPPEVQTYTLIPD